MASQRECAESSVTWARGWTTVSRQGIRKAWQVDTHCLLLPCSLSYCVLPLYNLVRKDLLPEGDGCVLSRDPDASVGSAPLLHQFKHITSLQTFELFSATRSIDSNVLLVLRWGIEFLDLQHNDAGPRERLSPKGPWQALLCCFSQVRALLLSLESPWSLLLKVQGSGSYPGPTESASLVMRPKHLHCSWLPDYIFSLHMIV